MSSSTMPPVTVIVLNWNARSLLGDCLTALLNQDYPHYRVVVVDNGSSDDSVAFTRRQFPEITVVETGVNAGFAAGNNVVLRRLETPIAALVNPDAIVAGDWLSNLVAPFAEDERIGIVGSKLYYGDGRTLQHAGGFLDPAQAIPGHYGVNEPDNGQHDQLRPVTYVTGAALAIRQSVLERVGLMDEDYFLYFEEVDLCWRARQAGYQVIYQPKASAVHLESALSKRGSLFYLTHFHTSRWRFLLKHYAASRLLQETIPAEKMWLPTIGPVARQAAAVAYKTALQTAPQLWATSGMNAMNKSDEQEKQAVSAELQNLRETAWQPSDGNLLLEKATVRERPFISHAPVIGPLIARFRESWNSVAAKWYVRGLLAQQNEFNQLTAARVTEHESRLIQMDREQTEAFYQIAELTAQVTQLTRRLRELEGKQE